MAIPEINSIREIKIIIQNRFRLPENLPEMETEVITVMLKELTREWLFRVKEI